MKNIQENQDITKENKTISTELELAPSFKPHTTTASIKASALSSFTQEEGQKEDLSSAILSPELPIGAGMASMILLETIENTEPFISSVKKNQELNQIANQKKQKKLSLAQSKLSFNSGKEL